MNVHPEWEERIVNYLVHKTHPVKTMELARLVNVRSRKEVNPTLYSMDRRGLIRKHGMQPPTWVIADPPQSHGGYNQNETHYSNSPGIYQHSPVSRTPQNFYPNNRESYRGHKAANNNYPRSKRTSYRTDWHNFCSPPSHMYPEGKNESLIYSHSNKDNEMLSMGNASSPNRLRSESCSPDECEALETAIANYPHSGGYGQGYSGHFPVTPEPKQTGKRRRNCDNFGLQQHPSNGTMPMKNSEKIQQKKLEFQDERYYDGSYASYSGNFTMNYANHFDMPVYHQIDREDPKDTPPPSRVSMDLIKKDSKDISSHERISPKRNSNSKSCNSDSHDPQARVISFLDKTMNGSAKSREIAKHTSLSLEDTQKILHSLCKKKIVTTIGEDIYIMAKNAASYENEIPAGKNSSSNMNSNMTRQFSSGNRQPPAPPHVLLADNGINSGSMKSVYFQGNNAPKQSGSNSSDSKSAQSQVGRSPHLPPSPHELLAKDPIFKGDITTPNSNASKDYSQSSSSSSASLSSSTSKNSRWNSNTAATESSRAPNTTSASTSSTTSFAPTPSKSASNSKQAAPSPKQPSPSPKQNTPKSSKSSKNSSKQRATSPKQSSTPSSQASSQSNSNTTTTATSSSKNNKNNNNNNTSIENLQEALKNTSISSPTETTESKTPTLAEIKAAAVAQALADKAAEKGADKSGTDSLAPNLQITSESFAALNKNPVSALMEYAQQRHLPVEFKLLSHRGPSHRPL